MEEWDSRVGPEREPGENRPAPDPRQLDLFASAEGGLARGRTALLDLDLEPARRELQKFLAHRPAHPEARALLEQTEGLLSRLEILRAEHPDPLAVLVRLGDHTAGDLRSAWHRRLAREMEARHGAGCLLDDVPIGIHWLLGDTPAEAVRSLRATLERCPAEPVQKGTPAFGIG